MILFALIFFSVTAMVLLVAPRRWAPLPLLMGACYMTNGQSISVGPFHFTVLRLLLLLGFARAVVRGERLSGGLNKLDCLFLAWATWLVLSSAFHRPLQEALVFRLGIAYNGLGIYFLLRVFCQTTQDLVQIIKLTAIVLIPVAIEMINEKVTGRNLFGLLGGVPIEVEMRDDKLRAQGPFGHAILAGTVGALCVPLMCGIWREYRRFAIMGLGACVAMVIASKSSGPIMTLGLGTAALVFCRWRHLARQARIAAVVGYVMLDLYMKDPAYFILARIDLTGSSTGWYRAELIRSAFAHVREWWFVGTDFTRHWMATALPANPDHCDLTNHYLYYGVMGGLPLMVLFISMFWVAFRYQGEALRAGEESDSDQRFLVWSLGASLFAHMVTCISVAYFEQSVMFLFLNLAVISSLHAVPTSSRDEDVLFELRTETAVPTSESFSSSPAPHPAHARFYSSAG